MRHSRVAGKDGKMSGEIKRRRKVIKSVAGACSAAGEKAKKMGTGVFREAKSVGSKALAHWRSGKQRADSSRSESDDDNEKREEEGV